ncbi:RND family efflux transporter, MFP subunit [Pseudomonas cuatrocienegasensis]|uniref:RND family efflux transporter, MFP subunit n=1 Tax=Pseudomonas cuatrocienegasensis TaxID=543360 RepID=A0ABY1B1R1_9PSED|nr:MULTISPECIES: efflux RND transporter periplasmic adaptor subunit [Pseudomonas]SEP70601.1 RND family efflux transporter, MFP subunit [Pseudomonas cuatrocienegasensis]
MPDTPSTLLTGDIQARFVSELSFRSSGKVSAFFVDSGDEVTAGQVLARLDPVEQQAALDISNVEVEALDARVKLARADYRRQQRLMPKGYTNRNDYERAHAALQSAEAELMTARARRQVVSDGLQDAALVAVADGLIVARSIEPGEVVQAGQSVLSLAHAGARDAVFDLYEGMPAMAGVGAPIRLHALGDPGHEVEGHVREIAPMVSADSGTLRMRLTLPAETPAWPLGSTVVARLPVPTEAIVSLPWPALTRDGDLPAVWRLDDQQRARLTVVEVVRFEAGRVLLASGLAQGDRVVARGGQLLYPGQAVEVASLSAAQQGSATE